MMANRLPDHHPAEDQLANYASGEITEAAALVIATHLALCPACRRRVGEYEALGGALLSELPEETLGADSLARTMAKLDKPTAGPAPSSSPADGSTPPIQSQLPKPLRDYLSRAWMGGGSWRSVVPGLRTLRLTAAGAKVWMMELGAGRPIPHHGHRGQEMVLVLSGGYHDGETGYGPGDLQISGPETLHRPIADEDGPCLCLVAVEGAIRPTSLVGRVIAALFGY
jgi:putative transcriptional regulator